MSKRLVLSIVSHDQGDLVGELLEDIFDIDFFDFETVSIVVTLNVPEDETFLNLYIDRIRVVRNLRAQGFGANHNQAFVLFESDYFVVMNPDLGVPSLSFGRLIDDADCDGEWGATAPLVLSPDGNIEDSARLYPNIWRILKRHVFKEKVNDYSSISSKPALYHVDWVAGMFILFRSSVFRSVGGFDTKYFMYLEDADICHRINKVGFRVLYNSTKSVIHDARRDSFRSVNHFKWHLRSMFRFLIGL